MALPGHADRLESAVAQRVPLLSGPPMDPGSEKQGMMPFHSCAGRQGYDMIALKII